MTGGRLVDGKSMEPGEIRGQTISGGIARHIGKGDLIDIPAGVPHWVSAISGKELVYLTCSYTNQCAFCSTAHAASGKKAGITDQEMQSLQAGQDAGFSEPEAAAIRYARELTRTANAAGTRDALKRHFNDEQIVEITMVAALANWTNRINNGLGVVP